MKIGFFDSGLGGANVLKCALDLGLSGDIYYFADTKNKPYGSKDKNLVKKLTISNIDYLYNKGCKVVVIACNTATALTIDYLRNKYNNITIIGTEPAVKIAFDEYCNKRILLLATTITINQEKLHLLMDKLKISSMVDLLPCDDLVKLIEDKNFNNMNNKINDYLSNILSEYDLSNYSHIVLGCTHFPLVKNNIQKIVGNNIKIVDGALGVSKVLLSKVTKSNKTFIHVITTSKSDDFENRFKEIIDNKIVDWEVI